MNDNKDQSVNENTALTQNNKKTGFLDELWQSVKLVYRLLLDPEVPIYLKILPFAAIVYLLMPFDFLPDVIPGLGQLDDLTILIVGAKMFIDLAPNQVVQRHLQGMQMQGDGQLDDDYSDDPDVIEGIIIDEIEDVE